MSGEVFSGWTDETQRLILALAVRGDMLRRCPGAVHPKTFAGASQLESPRSRLAKLITGVWDGDRTRPSPEHLGQLVAAEARKLAPEERRALEDELRVVLGVQVGEDASWAYEEARRWADYRRLATAITEAARALEGGQVSKVEAAREILLGGSALEVDDGRQRSWQFYGDQERRLQIWATGGGEGGEKIPTGLPGLDDALRGGPTKREVFYFLAPPKGAKTSSLLRVALGASRKQHSVLLVTYEMQALRMGMRLDRMLAQQTREELVKDQSTLRDRLVAGRGTLGEIVIDERPPQRPGSVAEAERRVEDLRRRGLNIEVVVLDFLNIMGSATREREKRHELAKVSREISALAKNADVLVWSAALVNRKAINKPVIRKDDIAEAFEVIAVADGVVAICGTKEMVRQGLRRYWVAAAREEGDEAEAGDYRVNFANMTITPLESRKEIDDVIEREAEAEERAKAEAREKAKEERAREERGDV